MNEVARGYIFGCRVGMPGVVIFGFAWGGLGRHPVMAAAVVVLGLIGTTFAWKINTDWFHGGARG